MRVARIVTILVVLIGGSILTGPPATAQIANADLAGTVTGADGGPLPGVVVTARDQDAGLVRTTTTTSNGGYLLTGLRPGTYAVNFELAGFRSVLREGVELRVGQQTRLNATLELGAVEESITITGEAPAIEATSRQIGGTLTAQEFEDLPTQNRSFALFAALLPGVTPVPSTESTSGDTIFVNGQDDNNNSFNVDGANNDDDVIGARAGAQTRTAIEAIQEFQVLTSQFDAEYGRSLGGVLNAVTKSGGNQFHGVGFGYFQRSSWNETDFFSKRNGVPKADSTYDSLGFTLGGPIVRDKLHFFVSYEDDQDQTGVAGSFATRPELNFSTTEDNHIKNVLGKVDYQPGASNHLSARYLRETSPQFNQIIGAGTAQATLEAAREEDDTDSNWIGTIQTIFTDRALNEGRVSFTKEDVAFANPGFNNNGQDAAAQRALSPALSRPTVLEGASSVAQARVNKSTQVDDTFSYYLTAGQGEHQFRGGVQWANREETFGDFGLLNGQFNFDTDRPFNASDVTTYPTFFTVRVGGGLDSPIPDGNTLGVFVQDDWHLREGLSFNLGVRWDKEDFTDDNNNYAPRVGFAWDPFGKGKTVVRGGWGRFYDRFQLGFYQAFFQDAVTITRGFLVRFPDAGVNQRAFFDIAQANGITTLTGLRDFLVGQLEGGARPLLNTAPTVDNPDRVQPYVDTASLGAEHEILPGITVGLDLIRSENKDTLLAVDLNPFSTARGGRPNISVVNGQVTPLSSVTTFVNAGKSTYQAVQLSANKRFDGRLGGRLSYTYADSEGNYGDAGAGTASAYFQTRTQTGYNFDTGSILGEPLDLNLGDPRNDGQPVNWLRKHNLVLSGTWLVPHTAVGRTGGGLILSGIYRYLSGDRTTLVTNTRLDNGNRAPAPSGTYDSPSSSDIALDGVHFDGRLFGAESPDFQRLDLSLRYRLSFTDRYSATLSGEVYNVTGEVNFASAGSTIVGTSGFLIPNQTYEPSGRQYQLGVRFAF